MTDRCGPNSYSNFVVYSVCQSNSCATLFYCLHDTLEKDTDRGVVRLSPFPLIPWVSRILIFQLYKVIFTQNESMLYEL